MVSNGLGLAFFTVLLMSIWDVFSNVVIDNFSVNPAIYAALSLFVAAFVLVIIAGPGEQGMKTLRSVHTWFYAIFQVLMAIFEMYSYTIVTATEFNLLTRIQILLGLFIGFAILGRKPSVHDYIGSLIILVGLGIVVATLPTEEKLLALTFIGLSSIFFVLRTIVAETHPTVSEDSGVKVQCRVTGIVLFVTSLVFMIFYAIAGYVVDHTPATVGVEFLPSMSAFGHKETLLAAFFCGAVIVAAAKYFYFLSVKVVNSENYTIIATFAAFFAFIFEKTGSILLPSYMSATTLDVYDILGGVILAVGAIYMVTMRRRQEHKENQNAR